MTPRHRLIDRFLAIPSSLLGTFLAGVIVVLVGMSTAPQPPVVPPATDPGSEKAAASSPLPPGGSAPQGADSSLPEPGPAEVEGSAVEQPEREGSADPIGVRCSFHVGSCRLEVDVLNGTNGEVSWMELRYEIGSRGVEERHEGRIAERPDPRVAPGESVVLDTDVPVVRVGSHEIEACVVRFVWHPPGVLHEGLSVGTDRCILARIYVGP
jgi:hypothetical protein